MASVLDEWMVSSFGGAKLMGGKLKYAQKTDPVPLHPPQTEHELTRKWTLAETVSLTHSTAHKEQETAV